MHMHDMRYVDFGHTIVVSRARLPRESLARETTCYGPELQLPKIPLYLGSNEVVASLFLYSEYKYICALTCARFISRTAYRAAP